MLVFLTRITVAASDIDTFVDTRNSTMFPAVQEQPGYGGIALLRPRTDNDTARLALLNWWRSAADQQRWVDSPEHEAMASRTKDLVRSAQSSTYEYADDLSLTVNDSARATMISIGMHQTMPGRSAEYIAARRDIGNPSMRQAAGFAGISTCQTPGDVERFMVVLEWADDAMADRYYDSEEHLNSVVPAIGGALTTLEPSERYDVLMRDIPGVSKATNG
ncbi:antibiotic biosynthesis monooxygenase [Kribbella shirazensis]|uniref:Heme-degrading monooxygenase HmoA n=1 Tax=Kribbella shirazensis TaxID=1105143 RepID=A0A7X6A4F1_9ACTN|nr:antibiotic biosynthesis monooxygenase [Kribbella shirazensis]NIK61442.1 heme-degrading monooxygenase HmoA [Kribbella shirazensis]